MSIVWSLCFKGYPPPLKTTAIIQAILWLPFKSSALSEIFPKLN